MSGGGRRPSLRTVLPPRRRSAGACAPVGPPSRPEIPMRAVTPAFLLQRHRFAIVTDRRHRHADRRSRALWPIRAPTECPSAFDRSPVAEPLQRVSHPPASNPCIAQLSGFSLHAGTRCQAHVRDSLERLCRTIARPAVSNERLSVIADTLSRKTPRRALATARQRMRHVTR